MESLLRRGMHSPVCLRPHPALSSFLQPSSFICATYLRAQPHPPTPAPWAYKLATLALKIPEKTSLVVQWTRIHLPMQGTRVRPLVFEYPTCHGATKPMSHNYWACALEPVHHNHWGQWSLKACAPQHEKLFQWEAWALQQRVAPALCN